MKRRGARKKRGIGCVSLAQVFPLRSRGVLSFRRVSFPSPPFSLRSFIPATFFGSLAGRRFRSAREICSPSAPCDGVHQPLRGWVCPPKLTYNAASSAVLDAPRLDRLKADPQARTIASGTSAGRFSCMAVCREAVVRWTLRFCSNFVKKLDAEDGIKFEERCFFEMHIEPLTDEAELYIERLIDGKIGHAMISCCESN